MVRLEWNTDLRAAVRIMTAMMVTPIAIALKAVTGRRGMNEEGYDPDENGVQRWRKLLSRR